MTEQRTDIIKRVVRSLEDTRDPERLVWAYFESDREALIQATRQTLEATREDASEAKIEDALERELIEALRYPNTPSRGLLPRLWVHRGRVATVTLAAAAGSLLLVLL